MKHMDKNGDEMKSGDHSGGIKCERVLDLTPTYADGELSSDLADSVRSHLMACSPCRLAVQDQVSLGAWFVPTDEVPVPASFASRVVELAFSGASPEIQGGIQGGPEDLAATVERQLTLTPRAPLSGSDDRGRLLSFSVGLTAAAAAAALLLTLFLASREDPGVGDEPIYADQDREVNLETLRQENRVLTDAAQDIVTQPEVGK